jgi:DNA-3-methyladenine glycosylase
VTRGATRRGHGRLAAGAPLPPSFYARDTELVARDLLGALLESRTAEGVTSGRIVEVEAYLGEDDPACHAAAGCTARTHWLYGEPGTAYIYFIYGVHWCFNAVTRPVGHPSAVLVRALEPVAGIELMRRRRRSPRDERELTNGPAKLCEALGITGRLNGHALGQSPLRILRAEAIPDQRVELTPRIGITAAADWVLRWMVIDSRFVSRTPRAFRRRRLAG